MTVLDLVLLIAVHVLMPVTPMEIASMPVQMVCMRHHQEVVGHAHHRAMVTVHVLLELMMLQCAVMDVPLETMIPVEASVLRVIALALHTDVQEAMKRIAMVAIQSAKDMTLVLLLALHVLLVALTVDTLLYV